MASPSLLSSWTDAARRQKNEGLSTENPPTDSRTALVPHAALVGFWSSLLHSWVARVGFGAFPRASLLGFSGLGFKEAKQPLACVTGAVLHHLTGLTG